MRSLPVCALALAATLAACSDPVTCGEGTALSNGRCVPEKLLACGPGTREDAGRCVPATTLTCGAGTLEKDGACVPRSELACGPGTEERAGECVVLDLLRRVTVPEAPEPNAPPGMPRTFQLPAIGADAVVLGGTVGPLVGGQPDLDVFLFTAAAGTRLRLSATAVGAPTVGVLVQPVDSSLDFARLGLATDTRGASREVVIPVAGDWLVVVSDQGNLIGGVPMGAAAFTYTVDVERVEPPAPTPLVSPATGDVRALLPHAVDVTDAAPVWDVHLEDAPEPGFPGQRALWATGPDGALLVNAKDDDYFLSLDPIRLALPVGRTLFRVDYVYALGSGPGYSLRVSPAPFEDLGGLATNFEQRASLAGTGTDLYAVETTGGELLSIEGSPWGGANIFMAIELRDRAWRVVQQVRGTKLSRFFPPEEAGRYFVTVRDQYFYTGKVNLDYTMKARLETVPSLGPVANGASASVAGTIPAGGAATYAIYAGNDSSLALRVTPAAELDAALDAFPIDLAQPIATANAGGAGAVESIASVVLRSGGATLARVSGTAGAAFTLEASAGDTSMQFEQEANDTAARANAIVLDASDKGAVAGSVQPGETDFFLVTVTGAARTFVFQTRTGITGGSTDTVLTLQKADGSQLASNDDAGGGKLSRVDATLAPAKYFLRVQRGGANVAGGDYVLAVNP